MSPSHHLCASSHSVEQLKPIAIWLTGSTLLLPTSQLGLLGLSGLPPQKTNICCHVLRAPDPRRTLWRRDAISSVTLQKGNKYCKVGWACPPLVSLGRTGFSHLAGVGKGISGCSAASSAPFQRCARRRERLCSLSTIKEQRTCAIAVYLYCCLCPCTWIQGWRRQMPGGLSLSSTAPCTSQPPALLCERGVLGAFWLLGSSQPWSFRSQVAKAQLRHWSQTSGAACYSTLRGAKPRCRASWHPVPVIRFQFLKSALAPLLAVGMVSAAGLQATSGQAATSGPCCLLLLAPQPTASTWPRVISLHPHAALWCASTISLGVFLSSARRMNLSYADKRGVCSPWEGFLGNKTVRVRAVPWCVG